QQFVARQTRRILLCIFAGMMGIVGSILFLAERNFYLLVASLLASVVFFLIVFLLPLHLLANPFRGDRDWR
ncbi:MAG: hypothetical protein ACREON_10725, partial [Gemmatimonadaceae bacterium]